jgi:hypothetical protein
MTQEQPPIVETNLEADRPQRTLRTIALQFLFGFAIGGLLMIPLSYSTYFTFTSVSSTQLIFALIVPLFLGSLAAIRGEQFISFLSRFLDSLPYI